MSAGRCVRMYRRLQRRHIGRGAWPADHNLDATSPGRNRAKSSCQHRQGTRSRAGCGLASADAVDVMEVSSSDPAGCWRWTCLFSWRCWRRPPVTRAGTRCSSSTSSPSSSTALVATASGLVAVPFVLVTGLPNVEAWPYLIGSVVIHIGYYLTLAEAYRFGDLGQVYPIARGCAPLLTAILADALAGREPGRLRLGRHRPAGGGHSAAGAARRAGDAAASMRARSASRC